VRSQESWKRPIRRVERAINSSLRLAEASRRVIDATERFAAGRPFKQTSRQLLRVSVWLTRAGDQLGLAVHGLQETTDAAKRAPERAADAPQRLFVDTARWIDAAGRVAVLSNRLEEVYASLRALATRPCGILLESPRVDIALRSALAAPRRIPSRGRLSVVPVRRRRHALSGAVDGARKVSRGRAPPSVSTCSL
jgi:hypothetical protein